MKLNFMRRFFSEILLTSQLSKVEKFTETHLCFKTHYSNITICGFILSNFSVIILIFIRDSRDTKHVEHKFVIVDETWFDVKLLVVFHLKFLYALTISIKCVPFPYLNILTMKHQKTINCSR